MVYLCLVSEKGHSSLCIVEKDLPVVIQRKHHRDNPISCEHRESLHRKLQAPLPWHQHQSLVFACLLGSNGGTGRSPSCVAYAAVDGFCPAVTPRRETGGGDADLSGAGFGDDEITWPEVGVVAGPEPVLLYLVTCWEREFLIDLGILFRALGQRVVRR